MSAKTMDIRIIPPIVQFKDCDVGKPLKRTVKIMNFGKVSREVRFLPRPTKVTHTTGVCCYLSL